MRYVYGLRGQEFVGIQSVRVVEIDVLSQQMASAFESSTSGNKLLSRMLTL